MILYLSSQQHTNLLDFLIEEKESLPVKKMTGNFMLKQFVLYDMRNFSHCTELVLDRLAFGDEDQEFVQAIEEFQTMYNARITVIYEGLEEHNPLGEELLKVGVGNLVTSSQIKGMQEEIRQSLSEKGMTRYAGEALPETKPTSTPKYAFQAERVRIALIGSQRRMGTTTAALGLVAWLGSVGARAAYIEKNESYLLTCLAQAYEMQEEAGGYSLEKMWYGKYAPEGNFHFLVEDYGIERPGEKPEVLALVCGTKPYEIEATMTLLEQYETVPAFILCPFVEKTLQNTYVEAFQSEYHKVFFLEYQPDCMDGHPNEKVYRNMIGRYLAGE